MLETINLLLETIIIVSAPIYLYYRYIGALSRGA